MLSPFFFFFFFKEANHCKNVISTFFSTLQLHLPGTVKILRSIRRRDGICIVATITAHYYNHLCIRQYSVLTVDSSDGFYNSWK